MYEVVCNGLHADKCNLLRCYLFFAIVTLIFAAKMAIHRLLAASNCVYATAENQWGFIVEV